MVAADLKGLFDSAARETFRLETRQIYRIPGEEARLTQWLADGTWPEEPTPWQRRIVELRARGVRMLRVHVVELPLTDYLRWEIASYRRNAQLGEDIRLLRPGALQHELPDDFWLFDGSTVVLMRYDEAGRLIGRDLVAGDPAPYVAVRDAAWAAAQPLDAWHSS